MAIPFNYVLKRVLVFCLLAFFFISSAFVQLLIKVLPFSVTSRYIGHHYGSANMCVLASPSQERRALAIGRICERATHPLPWKSKCLVQAILVKTILSVMKIPYAIYLGVLLTPDSVKRMRAHAWTTVGRYTVTGRKGKNQYSIVSTFIDKNIDCYQGQC